MIVILGLGGFWGASGVFFVFCFFYGDGSSSSVVVLLMDSNPRS